MKKPTCDGLYASFDGFDHAAGAGTNGDHWVGLEPDIAVRCWNSLRNAGNGEAFGG